MTILDTKGAYHFTEDHFRTAYQFSRPRAKAAQAIPTSANSIEALSTSLKRRKSGVSSSGRSRMNRDGSLVKKLRRGAARAAAVRKEAGNSAKDERCLRSVIILYVAGAPLILIL